MRPNKYAPAGARRMTPRSQLIANTVIKLMDNGYITPTRRRSAPRLIADVCELLDISVADLKDAWSRLDHSRSMCAVEMDDLAADLTKEDVTV